MYSSPSTFFVFLLPGIALDMEINKQGQQGGVEDGVEAPAPDTRASRSGEVVAEHQAGDEEAEHELHDLTVGHRLLPPRPQPDAAQEVVAVHQDVDGGVGDEGDREERLRGLEPDVAHDEDRRVVVHVEEREPLEWAGEDDEEGVDELEDLREVEHVCPEEGGPARWGLPGGEAEDPAAVGGLAEGGQGAPGCHEEGEDGEGEVVDGGHGLEDGRGKRRGPEKDEEAREGEVGENGEGEEERGGAEGVAWGPREATDRWVVDQPVLEGGEDGCASHFLGNEMTEGAAARGAWEAEESWRTRGVSREEDGVRFLTPIGHIVGRHGGPTTIFHMP